MLTTHYPCFFFQLHIFTCQDGCMVNIKQQRLLQVEGPGVVHVTGNIQEEDDESFMDGDMMMGEEESESEEEEVVSKSIASFIYGWTHGIYIR